MSAFTVTRSAQQAPDAAEPVIDWRQDGACRSEDPALFFAPDGFESPSDRRARVDAARGICAACDVAELCDQYAFTTRQQYGIWAGRDEDERAREIRRGWWRKRNGSES